MRPIGFLLRGSIVLALSGAFLALTTSVSAQCAWVLWNETNYTLWPTSKNPEWSESHTWTVIMADPSKAKCEAEKAWKIEQLAKAPGKQEEVKAEGNIVFITTLSPDGRIIASRNHRFICLPDTIDPRGKN